MRLFFERLGRKVKNMNRTLLFLFLSLLIIYDAKPQNSRQEPAEIRILNADIMEAPSPGMSPDLIRLLGNVRLSHEDVLMQCDSAHRYSNTNIVHAFGNVHINRGDTLHLYGDHLIYYGDRRYAEVRQDVRLMDRETILTTDFLEFDMDNDFGYYPKRGVVINGDNRLESLQGYYYTDEKLFFFKDSVEITNPDYIIKSDTLKYNTVTEIAYFFGPTTIIGDETNIYCENGWYNTQTDVSQFNENARVRNNKQLLVADSIFYDNGKGTGEAFLNVEVTDTTENIIIRGHYGWFKRDPEHMLITDSALLIQMSDNDTLYMHADTLRSWLQTDSPDPVKPAGQSAEPADSLNAPPDEPMPGAISDSLMISTPDSLMISTPDSLMKSTPDSLMKSTPDSLMKSTPDSLMKSTPDSLMKSDIGSLVVNDPASSDTTVFGTTESSGILTREIPDDDSETEMEEEISAENDTVRIMVAYYGVRFFSNDMQGKCDSLYYNMKDSIVYMFDEPVIWSEESQLTAQFMEVHSKNGEVDHIIMKNSAFVISEEKPGLYNQIKGKDITGNLRNGELYRVHVVGNAETLYYPVEDEEIIGINKAASASLIIFLKDSKPDSIRFLNQPEATLYPIEEVPEGERLLQNFHWLDHLRPKYREDVFRE
ncbi:MAG: OstA-like protein [Bacteroidales bacterium]